MNTITLTDAQALALAPLFAAVGVVLDGTAPAVETAPSGKAYRSAKGKAQAKADVAALWTRTLKAAKVTKRAQLTDAQFASYQAGAKAIWAAVPKTRSTKA